MGLLGVGVLLLEALCRAGGDWDALGDGGVGGRGRVDVARVLGHGGALASRRKLVLGARRERALASPAGLSPLSIYHPSPSLHNHVTVTPASSGFAQSGHLPVLERSVRARV